MTETDLVLKEERMTGVGGSDSPIILGVSTFGKTVVDLWQEKLGISVIGERNYHMIRGTRLEPVAAEEYAASTGHIIARNVGMYRHQERPYLISHPDGLVSEKDNPPSWDAVIEIKVPSVQTFLRYKREGIADYIQIQVQHYLAVLGLEKGIIWIWSPEVWQGLRIEVKRDEQIINLIYEKDEEFWHCVESGKPPVDLQASAAGEILADLPRPKGEIIQMGGIESWDEAARNLRLATELKQEAELIYEDCKARIIGLLEPYKATAAEGAGVRVYWQDRPGKPVFDKHAIMSDFIAAKAMLYSLRPRAPKCLLPKIDELITKDVSEKAYTRRGAPFKSFRPFFLKQNLIEE